MIWGHFGKPVLDIFMFPFRSPPPTRPAPHSHRAPLNRNVSPKIALYKPFWEIAWANMRQKWVKISLNHLFEHLKWCRNNFGKNLFGLILDPQVTPVTLP